MAASVVWPSLSPLPTFKAHPELLALIMVITPAWLMWWCPAAFKPAVRLPALPGPAAGAPGRAVVVRAPGVGDALRGVDLVSASRAELQRLAKVTGLCRANARTEVILAALQRARGNA
jgi:uncharacterized iron-regulated membrane protein